LDSSPDLRIVDLDLDLDFTVAGLVTSLVGVVGGCDIINMSTYIIIHTTFVLTKNLWYFRKL